MEEKNVLFRDLGLSEAMRKALEKKGYGYPTTIQQLAIPSFMQWKDVIAKAPTGTGKTFAFGGLVFQCGSDVVWPGKAKTNHHTNF